LLACRTPPVIDVLRASYAGVYVDEYQDCTVGQHALVMQLASLLPCRILGDPLQAIFRKINKGEALAWQVARDNFAEVGSLDQPHRWLGRNDGLGYWLLDVRNRLLAGDPVDPSPVRPELNFVWVTLPKPTRLPLASTSRSAVGQSWRCEPGAVNVIACLVARTMRFIPSKMHSAKT